jgi:hypothetical protein
MIFAESGPDEPSWSKGALPSALALGSEYAPGVSSVELVVGYLSAEVLVLIFIIECMGLGRVNDGRLTLAHPG